MRQDLRRLLKKSIFGLFVGLKVDNEIIFLNDVRKLLEKVKETYDSYYRDLMSILEDIYFLAIDKQFSGGNIYPCLSDDVIDLF
jgi:hypothetical protein